METVQFIHSTWAYLVLLVLVLATFNALIKFFGDKEFDAKDFRISLFALITMHIQLLIGIVLFFMKDYFSVIEQVGGMGEVMGNKALRNLIVEHPLTMIIAIALLTIGYSKHKKKLTSKPKFKMLAIFYTLALVLVLAKIPWNLWF
ncbi:cytochrome B [Winogradskyella damuponensis]|uniref:Cytochrome B n=2 Tax=Flavobacteriaceae TaxID=49546 RepID=A0ABP8CQG7_9FLAO